MIDRLIATTRLHVAELEADGFLIAGNDCAYEKALCRIALLRAELAPLGGDDDDEDGSDDDGKVAGNAR